MAARGTVKTGEAAAWSAGRRWPRRTIRRAARLLAVLALARTGQTGASAAPGQAVSRSRLEMVWIPAGSFTMGSPADEEGYRPDEGPQTRVTISRGFWLGKYKVTQGQWTTVMGSNPSFYKDAGENAPVESVSWFDALAFCFKLTEREHVAGRLPAGYAFTLPTEAQWEYACRAGTTGPRDGALNDVAWNMENSAGRMHPVGELRPNGWGLYDMFGDVWEWCLDWYGPYPGGSVTDPRGALSGYRRIERGGSWLADAAACRSAHRARRDPTFRVKLLGFRLALAPETDAREASGEPLKIVNLEKH